MTVVTHRALDGGRLELEADLDLSGPFTSVLDLGLDGRRHEFTAGTADLGDEVAAAAGVGGFTEELSYAGGMLLIGRAGVADPRTGLADDLTVATWRGRRYGLVTSLYNVSTADVLALLNTVRIAEHDDGIAIGRAPGSASTVPGGALVLKEVPGLGLLEITGRTREAVAQLPSWAGLRVPAGELFRDTLSNGAPYFVLATASAMVTVLPLTSTAVESVPELLGAVRIAMRTAPRW